MSIATDREPDPKPGGEEVWPLVIADTGRWVLSPKQHEALIADMQAREGVGRERYGCALQSGNGRHALIDAYQEALDLLAYLKQAKIDGFRVNVAYTDAMSLVIEIKACLMELGL